MTFQVRDGIHGLHQPSELHLREDHQVQWESGRDASQDELRRRENHNFVTEDWVYSDIATWHRWPMMVSRTWAWHRTRVQRVLSNVTRGNDIFRRSDVKYLTGCCCCFNLIARVIIHRETELRRPGSPVPDTVLTDKYNDGKAAKVMKFWQNQRSNLDTSRSLVPAWLDSSRF